MKSGIIFFILLNTTQLIYAQSDSISLKSDTLLEEVTIEGIRADKNGPISITDINKKQIESKYYGQEIPYLIQSTPSIVTTSDAGSYSGYTYFRLRGIDQTRINTTLNGVPLNEPEDQGVYFNNLGDFGNSIESIQIQRGVGTSTFGSSSYGGSINFESINLANTKAGAELNTSVGSYGTYRVSPEIYSGLTKGGFSFYGRYTAMNTNGYRNNSGNNTSSFFGSGAYFSKKDIVKFTVMSGIQDNQMAYLATSIDDIRKNPRMNYLTKDETDHFHQSLAQLQWTRQISKNVSTVSTLFYNNLKGHYGIRWDSATIQDFSLNSDYAGIINNTKIELDQTTFYVGASASTYQRTHKSSMLPNITEYLYSNQGVKSEFSSFMKIERKLDRLKIYGDVQMRDIHYTYNGNKNYATQTVNWLFLNPKIGATYQATEKVNVYTSVGNTKREPTRNDMFAGYDNIDSTNRNEVGSFKRVSPESVVDFELGSRYKHKKVSVQLNLYAMEFKNEIAAIGKLSYIGLPLRKNVASSFRRGIELDLTYTPIRGIKISQTATYSYNRIRSYTTDYDSITYRNIQPLLTPNFISNTTIEAGCKNYVLALSSRYVSSSYLDNTNQNNLKTPSYLIFNIRVGANIKNNTSINLVINNITNKLYYTSGYAVGNTPYYFVQASRNFYLTINRKF